ncbi:MAG: tetratricopeptide repeat protein [Janthinobacterium lividum]
MSDSSSNSSILTSFVFLMATMAGIPFIPIISRAHNSYMQPITPSKISDTRKEKRKIKHQDAHYLTAIILICLVSAHSAIAGDQQKRHKASGIGEAYGFILDADTHAYLSGANVVLSLPADTEPIKGSTSVSTTNGYYEIKAPLGESSSHFATDRIAELSIASLLGGGGKKVEHFVNVSEMVVSVSKPGYKTFYGTVPVEEADAERFQVELSPVLLMPETKPYVSYVVPHMLLGKIDSIHLSSTVLNADEVVKYTIAYSHLPVRPHTHVSVRCFGSRGGRQEVKNGNPQTETTYSGQLRIDKNNYQIPGLYMLWWHLMDNNFESLSCAFGAQIIAVGVSPSNKDKMVGLFTAVPPTATQFVTGGQKPNKESILQMAALLPVDSNNSDVTNLLGTPHTTDGFPSSGQRVAAISETPSQKQQKFDQQVANLKLNLDNPKSGTSSKIALAHLYYSHAEFDEAWSLYTSLFQNPDIKKEKRFYLFHDYAVLLLQKGRHEEALAAFTQALANGHANSYDSSALPTSVMALDDKLYTLYSGPERESVNGFAFPEAPDDLLIVEYDTDQLPSSTNWLSATILAKAMDEIGLEDQGLSILQQVVKLCPNEPEALFALASAHAKEGKNAQAMECVNEGLALNPYDPDALSLQTKLHEALQESVPSVVAIAATSPSKVLAMGIAAKHNKKSAASKKVFLKN